MYRSQLLSTFLSIGMGYEYMWEALSHMMSFFELNAIFWDLKFEN